MVADAARGGYVACCADHRFVAVHQVRAASRNSRPSRRCRGTRRATRSTRVIRRIRRGWSCALQRRNSPIQRRSPARLRSPHHHRGRAMYDRLIERPSSASFLGRAAAGRSRCPLDLAVESSTSRGTPRGRASRADMRSRYVRSFRPRASSRMAPTRGSSDTRRSRLGRSALDRRSAGGLAESMSTRRSPSSAQLAAEDVQDEFRAEQWRSSRRSKSTARRSGRTPTNRHCA